MFNTHNTNKKQNINSKAFTIIELLVVIAIIGLISSVVLVSLKGSTGKARISKSLEFSQTILNAIGVDAVGIWSFDEGSGGTAFDKSGYGNHGTLSGGMGDSNYVSDTPHAVVSTSEGRSAMEFNGTTDYIQIPSSSSLNITNAITIETWVKFDTTKNHYIVEQHHTYMLIRYSDDKITAYLSIGGAFNEVKTVNTVSNNKWYHLIFTRDTVHGMLIYINGEQQKTTTSHGVQNPTGSIDGGDPLYIGRYGGGGDYYTDGKIDEVRIYEHALSSAEIQQHYAAGAEKHDLALK